MGGCTSCGKKTPVARNSKSVATQRGGTTKPTGGTGKSGLVTKQTAYAGSGTAKMGMTSGAPLGHSKGTARTPVMNVTGNTRGRRGH